MNTQVNIVFDVLGVSLSLIFFILTIRGTQSLLGSFFKSYYRLLMMAAIALFVGFVIEPLGSALSIDVELVELIHHIGLIIASGIFVYASYLLPRDAANYLALQHKEQ